MPPLNSHVFVFGDRDDEQLLLLLAILSDGRGESRNPHLTALQIMDRVDDLPSPPHPSLTVEWPSHGRLVRALGRLRKEGLVTSGSNEDNARVWNLTDEGWERLGERAVFRPERR